MSRAILIISRVAAVPFSTASCIACVAECNSSILLDKFLLRSFMMVHRQLYNSVHGHWENLDTDSDGMLATEML